MMFSVSKKPSSAGFGSTAWQSHNQKAFTAKDAMGAKTKKFAADYADER